MKNEILISVVVPIYNVEKYLDRCIKSIINQTYENLEIILVDDGSQDKSGEICDLWKLKDNRIKVIHKKNGVLSDARNTGMDLSTGQYISFIDSDDWINEKFYEILINSMDKYNADIVACAVKKVYMEKTILNNENILSENRTYTFNTENALENLIDENILTQTVWNKLYKRECIKDVIFEFGKIHEDEFWTYQVIGNAKKVVYIDEELYYYLQRSGSIMGKPFSLSRIDALEARYRRLNYMKIKFPKLEWKAKKSVFLFALYLYQCMIRTNNVENKEQCKKLIKQYIDNIIFNTKEIKRLSKKEKIWIFMAKISLDFTCKFRNLLKIGV